MTQTKTNKTRPLLRGTLWLLLVALIIGFLIYFKGILIPFIYAIFASFLVYELVELIGKVKIAGRALPQWFRSVLVLLIVIFAVITIVEVISANVDQIVAKAPEYEQTFNSLLVQIGDLTGTEDLSKEIQEQISVENLNGIVSGFFSSFSAILGNLFMVILYSSFMLSERNTIPLKLKRIVKDKENLKEVESVLEHIGNSVQQYLSVKTFISFLTGVIGYVILLLFGVDFPVLWAFLMFLLNYIPYLGSFIATLLPALLAVFQFESPLMGLFVFLAIQGLQTLMGSVIEPRISGKTLNLSPTIVIFSLAFWGSLWGLAGIAIAIPLSSVLVIILAEFPSSRNAAILLSEKGDFEEET